MYSFNDCYNVPKDSDLRKFGIYCIENNIDGRQYVGSTTKSFVRRIQRHLLALKKDRHHSKKFQSCFNKSKEADFCISILEILEDKSREFVKEREQFWLDKLQPFYNMYKEAYLYSADYQHTEDTKKNHVKRWRLKAKSRDVGVNYHPIEANWCARISVNTLQTCSLGRFNTKEEALIIRKEAESLFWTEEFDRLSLEQKKLSIEKYRKSKIEHRCKPSRSGYKYICEAKDRPNGKRWRFKYTKHSSYGFYTLEEAIQFRDKYLEENNLL